MRTGCRVPLSCPACLNLLAEEKEALNCAACNRSYPSQNGVACFGTTGTFYGELPRGEMLEFLSLAESSHWSQAVRSYLPGRNDELIKTIGSPNRASWIKVLDLEQRQRALDYGCGLGGVSVPLAGEFDSVVSMDGTAERIRFLQIRCKQDQIDNIQLVSNGDVLHLPFQNSTFDLVVLNMVFPYLHAMAPHMTAPEAEKAIMTEFGRVLRPRGCVYLTVRNRNNHSPVLALFRKMRGMAEPELADNFLAQTYRYYRNLLRATGFKQTKVYWLLPNYRYPSHMIPVSGAPALAAEEISKVEGLSRTRRGIFEAAAVLGLLPFLTETQAFVAQR